VVPARNDDDDDDGGNNNDVKSLYGGDNNDESDYELFIEAYLVDEKSMCMSDWAA